MNRAASGRARLPAFAGLTLAAALCIPAAHAVVVRPGAAADLYDVGDDALPALADLPGEGHGVLIAPQWVVTATHSIRWQTVTRVRLAGRWRTVAQIVSHPGFADLGDVKMTGNARPLMAKLRGMDDITLLRLSEPVDDVRPIAVYRRGNETGQRATLYGKGATGDGRSGQDAASPHRGTPRRAENDIVEAKGRWLGYRFDCGERPPAREGVFGDGDSGGPLLLRSDGGWMLAGLADWKAWHGDLSGFRKGVCGQMFYNVRLSHYARWIDRVMAGPQAGKP